MRFPAFILTGITSSLTCLLLVGPVSSSFGHAAETAPSAVTPSDTPGFMAVSVPTLRVAQLSVEDKQLALAYIHEQLAVYHLSWQEYLALSPQDQREVLSLPGRQTPFSRQARRRIVPLKQSVPAEVLANIAPNVQLSPSIIQQFGVLLPVTLQSQQATLPAGHQRLLIGNKYVLLDRFNRVVDLLVL